MAPASPPLAGWELGLRLREARDSLGMTATEAAATARITQNYLSNVERGRRKIADDKLIALLDTYEVDALERDELLALRKESDGRGWWSQYSGILHPDLIRLYGYEFGAEEVHTFESGVISGLLQTESYSRAIHSGDHANLRMSEVERRVKIRTRRQQRLHNQDPLRVVIVMAEAVLWQQVGGTVVLAEQLERLLNLIDDLPNLELRIVPFTAGSYGAMVSSTFHVLSFPSVSRRLAWHENVTSLHLIDNETLVHQYDLSFNEALGRSADRQGSIELIKNALEQLK